jgi:phosphate transport system substrate-binding protein
MVVDWISRLVIGLAASLLLATAGANGLRGAGATFPALLYAQWASAYRQQRGVNIEFEAIGSQAGIERVRHRQVDFGASDVPLPPSDLQAAGLYQFPVVVGGITPVINLAGVKPGSVRLTGRVLAEIYLGRIRKWNDKAISELNPELGLPDVNITVVHRFDASGSSLLWSSYLSSASVDWLSKVGTSMTPNWPVGVGSVGNDGVASYVQRTRYSIGYVEYAYARKHGLNDTALRNRDGGFVRAGPQAFRSALENSHWADESAFFRQIDVDPPGAASWPITAASFVLVPTTPAQAAQTRGVLDFFAWVLKHGGGTALELGYEPIPPELADKLSVRWAHDLRGETRPPPR